MAPGDWYAIRTPSPTREARTPTLTVEYATDAERLLLERAVAYFADLRTVAHTAPHGTVIDACEALAPTGGRRLLRDSLASAVQTRLDTADAKKVPGQRGKGRHARNLLRAATALRELAGWTLGRESVRQLTHAAARRLSADRADRNDAARFARAEGVVEVAIGAGKANAVGGWRDVKVAVISGRTLGKPASATARANRELPAPTAVAVAANVEASSAFAGRVRAETDRLDATAAPDVTVPADGAEGIRNLAEDVLPQAAGVLDFYRAAERVAAAVTAIWPAGEQADGLFAGGSVGVVDGRQGGVGAVDRGGLFGVAGGTRRGAAVGVGGVCRPAPDAPGTPVGWRRVGASAAAGWRGRSSRW